MPTIGLEQLAAIVRTQAGPLRLYALGFLTGFETSAADDVVQEALIKLARQSPPPDEPKAWLYRVVRNAALTMRRGASRRRRHETDAAAERDAWFRPAEQTRVDSAEAA